MGRDRTADEVPQRRDRGAPPPAEVRPASSSPERSPSLRGASSPVTSARSIQGRRRSPCSKQGRASFPRSTKRSRRGPSATWARWASTSSRARRSWASRSAASTSMAEVTSRRRRSSGPPAYAPCRSWRRSTRSAIDRDASWWSATSPYLLIRKRSPSATSPVFEETTVAAFPGLRPSRNRKVERQRDAIVRTLRGKPREPFRYSDKGVMATIGRRTRGRPDRRCSPPRLLRMARLGGRAYRHAHRFP